MLFQEGLSVVSDFNSAFKQVCFVCFALYRSKLAIIPQDPFLFSCSVRENLDPHGHHPDFRLLDVLEQCHLGDVVQRIGESWSPLIAVFSLFNSNPSLVFILIEFLFIYFCYVCLSHYRWPGFGGWREGKVSVCGPKAAAVSCSCSAHRS